MWLLPELMSFRDKIFLRLAAGIRDTGAGAVRPKQYSYAHEVTFVEATWTDALPERSVFAQHVSRVVNIQEGCHDTVWLELEDGESVHRGHLFVFVSQEWM